MNAPTILRAASRFTTHGLLLGGAPATAVRPAEAMPEASALSLRFEYDRDLSPRDKRDAINANNEEAQAIVEEQTLLYQAAKKSYSRPATEGGR